MDLWIDGLLALFPFDSLSSSNSTLKECMFVAYVSPQDQRNLAEHAHKYGCTHKRGPAFRVISSYYFLAGVGFEAPGDKKATSAKGVVHTKASSVRSHLPAPPLGRCTSFTCLSELTHRASSLLLPQPAWPGSPATAARPEMSIFNGPEGQRRKVTSWGHFTIIFLLSFLV